MKCSYSLFVAALLSGSSAVSAFSPSSSSRMRPVHTIATDKKAVALPLPELQKEQKEPKQPKLPALEKEDAWVARLDYEGFGKEVTALGKKLQKEAGDEDVEHLNKIVRWRNIAALLGVSTMWLAPNPVTILALSTWTYASWTMIAHHTCHGGYNRMNASGFNSRGFALGSVWQRAKDWLDWMHPEAWNVEHNRLHHYRLNEGTDPDLVQRNLDWLRDMDKLPMFLKYFAVAFFIPIWKWAYYAPNTYKELQVAKMTKEGKEFPEHFNREKPIVMSTLFAPRKDEDIAACKVVSRTEILTKVLGPFFLTRFVLLPLPLLAIPGAGPTLFANAVMSLVAADLLTNTHAFITIVTNHAGEDLYTFNDAVKPKTPSFYVRQIIGSANYRTGSDLNDFSHGWLNYQIEHHVWPDFSMRQYQKAAPELKAICEKYGVPYVQESVFERLRKTIDIMIGKTTMRKFPTEYEPQKDKAGAKGVTWKSTNGAIDEE